VAHVLAVPKSQAVISMELRQRRAHTVIAEVDPDAWHRISCGDGAHGLWIYDWAVAEIRPLRNPRYGHWLLARRSISDPAEIAYYVCFGPAGTAVSELVRVAGSRWVTRGMLPDRQERDRSGPLPGSGLHRLVPAYHLVHGRRRVLAPDPPG
jgi:hypothetical protein